MIVDFRLLHRMLMPLSLRSATIKSFLNSAGTLFNHLLSSVFIWRDRKKYELAITPQVCYLEKLLNDEFDPAYRRIVITEPQTIIGKYFYRQSDNKDWYFDNNSFLLEDTRFGYVLDFIVGIPFSEPYDYLEKMKALVNKYKLIGKRYIITQI